MKLFFYSIFVLFISFEASSQSITVTSPNGGESWAIGNTHNITWSSVGITGNVKIEINGNYPSGAWETLYSSTSNDGLQTWTVSGVNGTAKRIRVTSVNNPSISDISNSNFTMTNPTITVTSPNGGESWVIGNTYNITWTSVGVAGNVKIEINGNYPSGAWETLYSSTSNDGIQSWTVSGVNGTAKRIRVTSVNNPSISDISNSNFTMTNPTITVTSPNGGESWAIGNTHNITWSSVGITGNVKVEINGNYPSGTWETLYSSISNDGTEAWTVTGVAGTEKRIRITSVNNPSVSDISNGNFTMTGSGITVTSPNGGETWVIGNTYNITWTSVGVSGNVKVEINGNYPSGTWETLYSSISNDGTEAWTVTGVAGTEKRIRITSVTNPGISDISNNNFTMTNPTITVTSPNGGESWAIGNTYNITWSSAGITGNVKIEINGNYPSGAWETLYSSTSNDGTEAWTVTGVAGTEKRIRVTSVNNPSVTDISNGNFTMTGSGITVTAPNGGESWIIGNTYSITWTSVGVTGNVKIEINGNYPSGTWETLYSSISNDGSEAWTVTGVAGTEKRIRITSVNNPGISDISNNNFTMTNPTITVTSPNGGESWAIGNTHNITWSSVGITGNVKVEINGNYPSGTWETLYSSISNDGTEAWTVTGVAGTEKRIRITSVNNPSVSDISNGNFTMTGSGITVTAPNGGESWIIGNTYNIAWTSVGVAGNVKIEINGNYPSGTWETLYSSISNDGTEAWTVTGVAGTEKRIRITSVNNPGITDISNNNFTMTNPTITVTSPNGGESWAIGNTHNITWSSVGITGNVKVEINGNYPSGVWETLYSSTSNDGTEAWTVTGVAGTEKRIRITSVNNPGISDISNNNFTMTSSCLPVNIISHPQNHTANVGDTVTFSVSVSGSSPYQYFWYKNNAQIPGANSSSYTTPALSNLDNGNTYKCIIINCNNMSQVISNNAVVTISGASCIPVTITSHPQSQSIPPGSTATFTVAADGTAPYLYTWFKNGVQISGANNYTYTTPILSISDNGSTFMCTIINCNGTNSVNSNNAVLSVNTTTPSHITINTIIPNNNSCAAPKELWKGNINQTASHIKICADASKATEIIFINNTGINSNNIRFLITSDPTVSNSDLSGYFENTDYNYNGNIIKAKFTHPKYLPPTHMPFRSDSIMIVDVTNLNNSIYRIPIQIYRAPVLFVHGIWSDRTVFNEMEASLDNSGYYINSLTLSADYEHSSSKSFEFNSNVIPDYIIKILLTARSNNFSAGKVDIICHSMGGILARQYIQSPPFQLRDDIHKLITINTPHSGTQGANLILNSLRPEGIASAAAVTFWLYYFITNGSIFDGAIKDLKVNSQAIHDLNYTYLNNGIVPSHSIISVKNPSFFGNVTTSFISAYVFASIPVFSYSVSNFFDYLLFEEDNDYYVSVQSQKGGLSANYTSYFDDVWHLASLKNSQVIERVTTLLNINSNNSNIFAQYGFSPDSLPTHYRPNSSPISVKEGSINITSPISGQQFNPGEVINISFNSSNGINRVTLEAFTEDSEVFIKDTVLSQGVINFTLPTSAFGKAAIIILGYNSTGEFIDYDTVSVNINLTSSLDSISFYPDTLYVQKEHNSSISLTGHFTNGNSYNIATASGIEYQIVNTNVANHLEVNVVKGIQIGTTELKVSYLDQTRFIPVVVVPQDILPVTSISPENYPQIIEEIKEFQLFQNYPNPFNPNTIIKYSLLNEGIVKIVIYNILGQIVKEVVNELQSSGSYEVSFNGNGLSSGIYFYSIVSGSYSEIKKMVLLR